MASAHPRTIVPMAAHCAKPCAVESATAASACPCTADTSRRNCIRCLAQCQVFLAPTATHLAHHHHTGMDTETHGQTDPGVSRQTGVQYPNGLDHPEPGPHRPLRIIFMRQGVPEVDEEAIAQILRDMPLKAGNHVRASVVIGPHYLAP